MKNFKNYGKLLKADVKEIINGNLSILDFVNGYWIYEKQFNGMSIKYYSLFEK